MVCQTSNRYSQPSQDREHHWATPRYRTTSRAPKARRPGNAGSARRRGVLRRSCLERHRRPALHICCTRQLCCTGLFDVGYRIAYEQSSAGETSRTRRRAATSAVERTTRDAARNWDGVVVSLGTHLATGDFQALAVPRMVCRRRRYCKLVDSNVRLPRGDLSLGNPPSKTRIRPSTLQGAAACTS